MFSPASPQSVSCIAGRLCHMCPRILSVFHLILRTPTPKTLARLQNSHSKKGSKLQTSKDRNTMPLPISLNPKKEKPTLPYKAVHFFHSALLSFLNEGTFDAVVTVQLVNSPIIFPGKCESDFLKHRMDQKHASGRQSAFGTYTNAYTISTIHTLHNQRFKGSKRHFAKVPPVEATHQFDKSKVQIKHLCCPKRAASPLPSQQRTQILH